MKPKIKCLKTNTIDIDNWDSISLAFRNAEFVNCKQGWSESPDPSFRPARIAATWTNDAIYIYAELQDDDIFNPIQEEEFNKLSIEHGDVFEIFLRPASQNSYYEFHINPNNQKFQLRLPFQNVLNLLRGKFDSMEEMLNAFKVRQPIESRVKLEDGHWFVIAKIPFQMVVENISPTPGVKWRFSFSRYDYNRHCKKPVYSSTSPHRKIDFHLLDDYGTLEFI